MSIRFLRSFLYFSSLVVIYSVFILFQEISVFSFSHNGGSLCQEGWELVLQAHSCLKAVGPFLSTKHSEFSQLSCKSQNTDTTLGGPLQMAELCSLMEGFPGITEMTVKGESSELSQTPPLWPISEPNGCFWQWLDLALLGFIGSLCCFPPNRS